MSRSIEQPRLAVGVAASSFGYLGGFVGAETACACREPLDASTLMDLATAHGLGGVEFPVQWIPSRPGTELEKARVYAVARHLFVILDSSVVEVPALQALLPLAAALGAPTVRTTVSTILCGDRRAVRHTWLDHLAEITRQLRAVRGLAEELGVAIALENHQDLTSTELVALCEELGSPQIGVTLDTGNPLAVGEDPQAYARAVAPYLKHVHLKDYRLFVASSGYRLVRCPLGAGIVDLPAILSLCRQQAPCATMCIELGALEARHVRLLEEEFWEGYPSRRIEQVLPVLRLRDGGETGDWRTPWERGEDGAALARYEREQFEQSVEYLQGLRR